VPLAEGRLAQARPEAERPGETGASPAGEVGQGGQGGAGPGGANAFDELLARLTALADMPENRPVPDAPREPAASPAAETMAGSDGDARWDAWLDARLAVAQPSLLAAPASDTGQPSVMPAAVRAAPTIHVTIGRVEVRAQPPAAKAAPLPGKAAAMSLDEYLRQRSSGGRR
jgi:hypothetical protein